MRDRDVREAVWRQLTCAHAADPETRLVQEMGVWSGTVRIDIAVINGELSGFELKSDRDTLARLPFQAEIYSKVFDRITLVVGSRHASKIGDTIPSWWGITVATQAKEGVVLDARRASQVNPSADPYLVAQLLWKEEALDVLDRHGISKGWRAKRVKFIHEHLARDLPFDELRREVRSALKRRPDPWLRQMMSGQLDVSVDADLHPVLKPLG